MSPTGINTSVNRSDALRQMLLVLPLGIRLNCIHCKHRTQFLVLYSNTMYCQQNLRENFIVKGENVLMGSSPNTNNNTFSCGQKLKCFALNNSCWIHDNQSICLSFTLQSNRMSSTNLSIVLAFFFKLKLNHITSQFL